MTNTANYVNQKLKSFNKCENYENKKPRRCMYPSDSNSKDQRNESLNICTREIFIFTANDQSNYIANRHIYIYIYNDLILRYFAYQNFNICALC